MWRIGDRERSSGEAWWFTCRHFKRKYLFFIFSSSSHPPSKCAFGEVENGSEAALKKYNNNPKFIFKGGKNREGGCREEKKIGLWLWVEMNWMAVGRYLPKMGSGGDICWENLTSKRENIPFLKLFFEKQKPAFELKPTFKETGPPTFIHVQREAGNFTSTLISMLMTSLRIYSEKHRNQASERAASLLCSFPHRSPADRLPVNTHIHPIHIVPKPGGGQLLPDICFICIWPHKCHPFWARCSSAGPV